MIPVPFACNPGDKLRVTRDNPYGTELVTGDLVTVEKATVKVEKDVPIPVVVVHTAHGRRVLALDAVEPWNPPTYTPAEPDEIIDARLKAIFAAEPDLTAIFADADTALGAVDPLQGDPDVPEGHVVAGEGKPEDNDAIGYTDGDGDYLRIAYVEREPGHAALLFSINDEERVAVDMVMVDHFIRYLQGRNRAYRDGLGGGTVPA